MKPSISYNAGKFDCFEGTPKTKGKYMADITVTVPIDDTEALIAASNMLLEIAGQSQCSKPLPYVKPLVDKLPDPEPEPTSVITKPFIAPTATLPAPEPEPEAVSDWPKEHGGVMIDSQGLPWDARIHSGNKKCKATNGRWMYRRGGDKLAIPGVEAELKASMEALGPITTPEPPVAPVAEPDSMSFPEFISWAGSLNDKYRTSEGLNELCSLVGLSSVGMLASNTGKIKKLVEILTCQATQ